MFGYINKKKHTLFYKEILVKTKIFSFSIKKTTVTVMLFLKMVKLVVRYLKTVLDKLLSLFWMNQNFYYQISTLQYLKNFNKF